MSKETKLALLLGLMIIVSFSFALDAIRGNGSQRDGEGARADDFSRFRPASPADNVLTGVIETNKSLAGGAGDNRLSGDSRAPVATARRTYTVKPNDSLTKIATKVYGAGCGQFHNLIYDANRTILPDEGTLRPGQVLVIPPLPSESSGHAGRPWRVESEAGRSYSVRDEDSY